MISDAYKRMNEELHRNMPHYGTSGDRWASQISALAMAMGTEDILDYGCGKSTLANNLPFKIKQYDPCISKYSSLPFPADLVVCTDVLEHVEPEMVGDVLDHLKALVKKKGFFVISTSLAKKELADGRNAHLIVESPRWWLNALWDKFNIVGFQDIKDAILVVVDAK